MCGLVQVISDLLFLGHSESAYYNVAMLAAVGLRLI